MEKILKNKILVYGIMTVVIIMGIIATCVFKLNFTLMYSENTRMNVYIGKEYKLEEIKEIAEEVFETKQIEYQKIENFNEAISITVKEASEEQIENLANKIKEKYELDSTEGLIQKNIIGHLRGRDIVKPYIIPIIILTVIILAYLGIRYINLGIFKIIFTVLIKLIVAEALYISIIAITRIPIGMYTMPIAVGIYILIIMLAVVKYEKKIKEIKENKK